MLLGGEEGGCKKFRCYGNILQQPNRGHASCGCSIHKWTIYLAKQAFGGVPHRLSARPLPGFRIGLGGRMGDWATVLPTVGFDHWPICLEWGQLGEFVKHPFWFEKFWFQHLDFHRLMKEWWERFPTIEGSCMFMFQ